ncbi:hypothetical protein Tco_0096658 [Tanacetum coccineum]
MATYKVLDELMKITGSTELHKRMRFWFVQEIAEEEGLLKFLRDRCDDLRRKNVRRRVLICEMEALGERGVAVDSLESLKQTHARETAKLAALTDAITESLASIHEKERPCNAIHKLAYTSLSGTSDLSRLSHGIESNGFNCGILGVFPMLLAKPVETYLDIVTIEEKAQKKNDIKVRSMLLMALPNKHQLTFNQYRDANTLFDAIATRKTQKSLLKQMYENFNALSTESLDSIFNKLHKTVSQLSILVVWRNKSDLDTMSFDDLYNNFKIIEQEVKRTVTSSLNSNSSSQNMAFVSSPSSTNKVNIANVQVGSANSPISTVDTSDSTANLSDATVYAFLANQPNGSQLVHEDLEQIHEDNLEEMNLKWQLALLCMRARMYFQRTGNAEVLGINIIGTGIKTAQERLNVEETSSKAMVAIDGAGFDWGFMTDEEVPTNMALMAFSDLEIDKLKKEKKSNQIKIDKFKNASTSLDKLIESQISDNSRKGVGFVSYNVVPPPPIGLFATPTIDLSNSGLEEFQQPEFKGYGPKASKSVCKDTSNEVMKTPDALLGEKLVSKKEKQTVFPTKIESAKQ